MPKRENKENIFERAADIFDLPGEIVAGMSRITITGCRRVFIENHRGILEYGREEIDVNGGRVIIKLKGKELELRSMSDRELLVTGLLTGISFEFC